MRVEHIALNVPEPSAMAAWYGEHCGFTVRRKLAVATDTHFLADAGGHVLLEIYCIRGAVPAKPLDD